MSLIVGCHVSAAGGVWNAPKNAADLECEAFQIFTRPPMGGEAPELTSDIIGKFKDEMKKYYPTPPSPKIGEEIPAGSSPLMGEVRWGCDFVVHCPYFINFGSAKPRIYHSSISVVREELNRASLLGAKFVMAHLGSFKDLGEKAGMKQVKMGLKKVLDGYAGSSLFLIEIAAGAGEIIGDTFEELAELMEPIKTHKGFGGICFDTQHAFASGYDLRDTASVASTFAKFDKAIGLKWLKMSHINDSKTEVGSRKDRHEHIGEGKIGQKGFKAFLEFLISNIQFPISSSMPLILETKPDKVKADINLLKKIRNKNI